MSIQHVKSVTIPDSTDTNIVRPTDWNSVHILGQQLSGNTGGTSLVTGTNIVFNGGNNLTLNATQGAGAATIQFDVPNFLTTAMASDASSLFMGTSERANYFATNAFTFANSTHSHGNPTLALTNLSGTTASNSAGLTLSLSAAAGGAGQTSVFSNSNGISFGTNGSTVTASYTVPTIPGATVFSNSNNVSFGLVGSTVTATATFNQSVQTQNSVQVLGSSGNISFANSNGITFGGNASTITASHNGLTSQSNQAVSAANGSSTFQTISFANSNGVTWSTGTQGLFASVKTDYLTTAAQSDHSHGNPTLALTNLSGTTASNSAGFTLSLSAAAGGGGADGYNILAAGGVTGPNSATVELKNSNGISFGLNTTGGSTYITGTVKTDYLTTAMASNAGSNFAGTSTGATNASVTLNSLGIAISVAPGGGGADGYNIIAAGGSTANTTGTIQFANSNGVSFGLNGATVTASHNGITQQSTQPAVGQLNGSSGTMSLAIGSSLSASTNGSTITFGLASNITTALQSAGAYLTTARASNDAIGLNSALTANGVSMTANSSGLSLNFPAFLTTQSAQAFSADASSTFQTLSFQNSNGVSFSNNAGALRVTHDLQFTSNTSNIITGRAGTGTTLALTNLNGTLNAATNGIALSLSNIAGTDTWFATGANTIAGTNTTGTFANDNYVVSGAGAISVGVSNNTLVISGPTGGGGGAAISAAGGSQSTGTVVFSNSNGVSFGYNNGTITATVVPGAAAGIAAIQNSQTTYTSGTVALSAGGGAITVASNTGQRIDLSVPNTSQLSVAGGPMTIGTAGNTISFSVGGAGVTLNNWEVFPAGNNSTFSSAGQNSLYLQKLRPENNYAFSFFERRASGSFVSSTNSQVVAHSISYGLYVRDTGANSTRVTLTASSSMFINASYNSNTAMGFTVSQGAGSFTTSSGGTAIASLMSGYKHFYLPFSTTLTAGGEYWFGMNVSSATTVGTSPLRLAFLEQTVINNLTIGKIHASTLIASNASHIGDFNQAVYSATTGAFPSSIADSQVTNAISQARMYLQLDG